MTLPQGVIWQELRSRGLDVVPHKCRCQPSLAYSVSRWLSNGSYSVVGSTKKSVLIEAPIDDIGALLLADAGLLLDHSLEHALQLRHAIDTARWQSPAWAIVTSYYWAFFSALAITRMTGHTVLFISDTDARVLKGLSPSSSSIGPGPLLFSVGPAVSATMREVQLKRGAKTRVHDTLWSQWFSFARDLAGKPANSGGTTPELRLYWPLVRSANMMGDDWPSVLRNVVNYVPGHAYGAARGKSPAGLFSGLSATSSLSPTSLVERLEADVAALDPRVAIRDQLRYASRLLGTFALVLDVLANDLFAEIADRRGIDRRWVNARQSLRASNWAQFEGIDWPVSVRAA